MSTYRVQDTGQLARTITGTCGIQREIAEQLVAELLESEDKSVQFETQTILTGKPKLSRTRSTWVAREVRWKGISEYTGYELRRMWRTEA